MAFKDLREKMVNTCFSKLGEIGVYTSKKTGIPKKVSVIRHDDVEVYPGGFESSVSELQTQLDFLRKEVSNPKSGDVIKLGPDEFTIDDILPGSTSPDVVKVVVK
ncbi:MAG: hypothetical protein RPU42_11150 [Candidatus Sedimenticola sp. (ex Thyasira tokunagai)]